MSSDQSISMTSLRNVDFDSLEQFRKQLDTVDPGSIHEVTGSCTKARRCKVLVPSFCMGPIASLQTFLPPAPHSCNRYQQIVDVLIAARIL